MYQQLLLPEFVSYVLSSGVRFDNLSDNEKGEWRERFDKSRQLQGNVAHNVTMTPDSKKKLDVTTILAEKAIAIAIEARDVALKNNLSTLDSTERRHTTYSNLYKNCEAQCSISVCPAYLKLDSAPDDFFPLAQTSVKRGDEEKVLQRFGNSQFRQFQQSMTLVHHDSHNTLFYSSGDTPDNVFCPLDFVPSQMVAVTVLEWKRFPKEISVGKEFSPEEKGQAISYAQLTLDAQKWRTSALVCISNLDCFQCFEAKRVNKTIINVYEYQAVTFNELGREILWAIITTSQDLLGFVLEQPKGLSPQMQFTHLACGGSSLVYEATDPSGEYVVIKVYRQEYLQSMRDEIAIYELLIQQSPPPSIGVLKEAIGENCVTMSNYGKMLSTFHPASCYCDILRALKYAHSLGITHNDVRSPNIVVNGLNQATLIDWGIGRQNSSEWGKKEDTLNLIKLFITNKYFHGYPPEEPYEARIPKIFAVLIDNARRLEYDELLEALSTKDDATTISYGVKKIAI